MFLAHPRSAQLQSLAGVIQRNSRAEDLQSDPTDPEPGARQLANLTNAPWCCCLVTEQAWLPLISCLGESHERQVDAKIMHSSPVP